MRAKKNGLKKYDAYIEHLEEKLAESYKHLGIINRQVSILLDLNKKRRTDSLELLKFITNSSVNLSKANISLLFKYDSQKKMMDLLSITQAPGNKKKSIPAFCPDKHKFLAEFIRKKKLVQGRFSPEDMENGLAKTGCKYFASFPLMTGKKLMGMLMLGFSHKECLSTQELEFFEAFATQSSFVLEKMKALK